MERSRSPSLKFDVSRNLEGKSSYFLWQNEPHYFRHCSSIPKKQARKGTKRATIGSVLKQYI